jgi:hypothetical protein
MKILIIGIARSGTTSLLNGISDQGYIKIYEPYLHLNHNKKFTLSVIFIGFFFSVLLSINNLNKYDKNLISEEGISYHQMIKGDPFRYLSHGNEIKDQLENNLNFFETGREHYTKYLPPRVYALY